MPVTRKRRVEVARLAGFGLVLAGVLALVLAVLSAQNAGATDPGVRPRNLSCHTTDTDQIGWAVMYGACSATTTTDTSTSQPEHHCGCSTTTTYVTTTTQEHHCGCSTTTTSPTTTSTSTSSTSTTSTSTTSTSTTSTSTSTTTSTSTPAGSTGASGPTGETGEGGPTGSPGVTGAGGPTGGVSPVGGGGTTTTVLVGAESAQQLPFTGSSSFPLAGVGIVFILSGGALALRRRRLAR